MIHLLLINVFIMLSLPFSDPPAHDRLNPGWGQEECVDCHSDLAERDGMHYPVEDACENCHESTGASHPSGDSAGFRLMVEIPALCYSCHEETLEKSHEHRAVTDGNCLGCHDAHGSSESFLLRFPDPDLCLGCHNRVYRTDSSETVNISRLVQGTMLAHSAIPLGGCMSCHQAHGSDSRALLVGHFPEETYLPGETENFELCFICHDTDLINAGETESGTGFRNGNRNLHRVHIKGNKGRNCSLCHNIHGSSQSFLMEENVPFGSWEMQMNFVRDEQGGSCMPGCHGKLSYRR